MKQILFNVGGALSTYIEFDNKTLLVDIGKGSDFNPIADFLLPLYKKRNSMKSNDEPIKYQIDQLLISHPHKDHISAIEDFDKYFFPTLLTTPNNNQGMLQKELINWEKVGNEEDSSIIKLREMLVGRQPPLRVTSDQNEFIYYIAPKEVEKDATLSLENYCNNISIVIFLIINGYRVFLPGDIQKEGMKKIIDDNHFLKNKLKGGVDVLIAPHHGLKSSFSTYLFENMKDKKTRSINIVSEKVNNPDEARDVDSRYSSSEYCMGENNLKGGNGIDKCYQIKTSRGHIVIDYQQRNNPVFDIYSDINDAINRFLK